MSTCSSSSYSPKPTDARGIQWAACSPLSSQPLRGLQNLSPLGEVCPLTSCLSQYTPQQRQLWRNDLTLLWRVCRNFPLTPPSGSPGQWLHADSPGGTWQQGPRQHTSKKSLEGKFKNPLVRTHQTEGGKCLREERRPRGHWGQVQSPRPGAADKARSEASARSPGDTRRGGARRGLPRRRGGGSGELIRAASRRESRGGRLVRRRAAALGEARRQQQQQ